MKIFAIATIMIANLLLAACTPASVNHYRQNTPKLVPQEFFNGDLLAHGLVKNRSGEVIRYFTATIKAHWRDGVGTLEERFVFNDGEIQYRTWQLTPDPDKANYFFGTAGDVVGTGRGSFAGNAINLAYVLNIKRKDSTIDVAVDDWLWLVDDTTVLNETTLRKFGFKVGSVQLVIKKMLN